MFFLSCVCYTFVCVCLLVPWGHLMGKGWCLGSRLWCLTLSLLVSHWYPWSGVVLDCIDSWSLHPYLLFVIKTHEDHKYFCGIWSLSGQCCPTTIVLLYTLWFILFCLLQSSVLQISIGKFYLANTWHQNNVVSTLCLNRIEYLVSRSLC